MSISIKNSAFYQFLTQNFEKGTFSNDEVVAVMMPLLKTVAQIHGNGKVAGLHQINEIFIAEGKLNINDKQHDIVNNLKAVLKLFPNKSHAFEISEEYIQKVNVGETVSNETVNSKVASVDENGEIKPVCEADYGCFELRLNHHDPLTDIYILGMLMASIALHFDFTNQDDLTQFVELRNSMVFINPTISPAIANIILGMTELDRGKRWKDLNEIIEKLKNYRDYNPETEYDLAHLAENKKQNRNQFIHERLRNRLFDSSRRNRLLYYQPNLKFLNLTISSVPQVLNYQNIDENSIFYWNKEVSQKIINGNTISLNKYLQIEDNPYIIPTLDKIRLEANKDINEYGFSQLKLVLCYLNWYNTKESGNEKIVSPLLLVSVNLVKKKGLKDQYTLEFNDSEVEINPVLSNMLKDLYNIRLPETIQLAETKIEDIYELLNQQIIANNSGIVLDYVNKPKIKLVHSQAKQTLAQYNKRNKKRQSVADLRNVPYSYDQTDFQPYGLELFNNYVKLNASSLEYLINSDIKLSPQHFNENKTVEREFYNLDEGNVNPFRWEFDTCNLVLGNFNYKKMSLVRDYNLVIDEKVENTVFKSLFNALGQKEFKNQLNAENTFTQTFNVVASDPTQNKAVKYSEAGESYIIQGPPGTGKSQTIANLVANYVANGKKVLFVCEKRAALDVVFYRLKNQGLDDLCCLIHDSQADKKEFIQNLKRTFNDFIASKNHFQAIENTRNLLVKNIENEIANIAEFHGFMNNDIPNSSITVQQIFDVLISNPYKVQLDNLHILNDKAGYADWQQFENELAKLYQINNDTNQSIYFSNHPFRFLKIDFFAGFSNLADFKMQLEQMVSTLENIGEKLDFMHLPNNLSGFDSIFEFLRKSAAVIPFYEKGKQALLLENGALLQQLEAEIEELLDLKTKLENLQNVYPHWQNKLVETDAVSALEVISKSENNFFNFLNGNYRTVKKQVLAAYNINNHAIKPKLSLVLQNLIEQYQTEKLYAEKKQNFERFYQLGELFALKRHVALLKADTEQGVYLFVNELNSNERKELTDLYAQMQSVQQVLQNVLDNYKTLSLSQVENLLQSIINKQTYFQLYVSVFQDLKLLNPSVLQLIKTKEISLNELQNTLAEKSLEVYYGQNYGHKKFNMDVLHASIQKIKKMYAELLETNGKYIIAKQKNDLKQLIIKSEMSVAGMSEQDKTDKKAIAEGRKILENEFNKNIRFKSIRELATAESGQIIREIKPVWLMSPLSVSDTLPINQNYFDVVIFDEASQITLEEGLPPIYRAQQTIIVGDEMQMPPSNFFGSSANNQDDLWQTETDDEDEYFSLDADSFLSQGARKFPSIMLGWHYRSKHEALIGFSNASFYDNQLLTIPDVKDHQQIGNEIIVENTADAVENTAHVHQKPISYHYIKNGVYAARSNQLEAEYIAEIVRALLFEGSGNSIGIVAFSMEQQNEIETAIEALCIKDKKFENLLEEEYKRIEDNQFVGLFVKNLENVQGNERDIIIMSTCYGYDGKGKMLMNFGPINKRGGEKRLNVIFSRAKKSMCVVSSIKYFDIKNEYNEGANYFRKYLQYAELVSLGQLEAANNVLNAINNKNNFELSSGVVNHLKAEIEKLGYYVTKNIGQSKFKCNLAVKKNEADETFLLGIILDDDKHYANNDILEQYLLKPEILKSNGWNICQIYSKDWIENKERVVKLIHAQLKNETFFDEIEVEVIKEIQELEQNALEQINSHSEQQNTFDRYISTANGSHKFWEICTDGANIIVQYGKVGTKGQRMIKAFGSEDEAKYEMNKLIAQKVAKDYVKETE